MVDPRRSSSQPEFRVRPVARESCRAIETQKKAIETSANDRSIKDPILPSRLRTVIGLL
jgi:hypothetical protein